MGRVEKAFPGRRGRSRVLLICSVAKRCSSNSSLFFTFLLVWKPRESRLSLVYDLPGGLLHLDVITSHQVNMWLALPGCSLGVLPGKEATVARAQLG